MNEEHFNTEINTLNNLVAPALSGVVISAYMGTNDETIVFVTYRQSSLQLATYLKLSSVFKANSPIDCHVVDKVDDKFRFTIIYNVQSFNSNTRVQLVCKTNDILPLVSLQGIYPAFN